MFLIVRVQYVDHQKTWVESLWQKICWKLYKVLYQSWESVRTWDSFIIQVFDEKYTRLQSPTHFPDSHAPPPPNFLCPLSRPFYPQSTQSSNVCFLAYIPTSGKN